MIQPLNDPVTLTMLFHFLQQHPDEPFGIALHKTLARTMILNRFPNRQLKKDLFAGISEVDREAIISNSPFADEDAFVCVHDEDTDDVWIEWIRNDNVYKTIQVRLPEQQLIHLSIEKHPGRKILGVDVGEDATQTEHPSPQDDAAQHPSPPPYSPPVSEGDPTAPREIKP